MSRYTRVCRAIARGCMVLGITGIVLLIACVTWQVFGRYVLNNTPTWAESLALLLVLYVTMLGTAVGVRDAGHIGLESLLVLAPEGVRLKMEYLIHALVDSNRSPPSPSGEGQRNLCTPNFAAPSHVPACGWASSASSR